MAKSLGATVIAVTHAAGSALTEEADYSIVHGFELNYAAKIEKMGYVIALAVELLQQTEGYEHYDALTGSLTWPSRPPTTPRALPPTLVASSRTIRLSTT